MKRWSLAIVIAMMAGSGAWWKLSQSPKSAAPGTGSSPEPLEGESRLLAVTSATATVVEATSEKSEPPALPGPVQNNPRRVALAAAENAPAGPEIGEPGSGLTPLAVLENVRAAFREYQLRFGANPVGDNTEITASLNGQNARQVNFISSDDGLRVNDRGEMIDNWGTPFFFHQLSRTEMEIHSAGPDRKMWSQDDLVLK